jgi:hypothetical protein
MKTFTLMRYTDSTGISGTGEIAEGVQFTDGSVVLRWHSSEVPWGSIYPTIAIHPNIENVEVLHGHNGATRVVWT